MVIGEGWHRRAGEPHAERIALETAGERASGATAYVTLEPCCHYGKTLPCTDGLLEAGVSRVVAAMPDRFAGVVLSNGGLPAGQEAPKAFAAWRRFARYSPIFPIGGILQRATKTELSDAEVAAYDAPFPTRASKAGARIFPQLVPLGENVAVPDQLAAWEVLERFERPFTCAFSDGDPITRGGEANFIGRVPGSNHRLHRTLRGGHFIQEDDPQGFVEAIVDTAKAAGIAPG